MTDTLLNLDSIESGYTVFEKDQVLTPEQLNGLTDYLDDQERLTRISLIGVGIACGLWPSLEDDGVRVSPGVGVTTDGDVVRLPAPALHDRYKKYNGTAPKYASFYHGDAMVPVFELVAAGKQDDRALPLSGFGAEGRDLAGMAAVLLVESHLHDPDLCSGEDCDNRGQNAMHVLRVLLVDAATATELAQRLDTPDRAFRAPLTRVFATRPVLIGAIDTEAELADLYRAACDATYSELTAAFEQLYAPCRSIVADFLGADPAPGWRQKLDKLRAAVANRDMQYYYDFLKDLAETHAALLDALAGDDSLCCPDAAAFPKHLVLGALQLALRAGVARTRFYPSPAVGDRQRQRSHVRFLFRKLDTLIASFALPAQIGDIRITPSHREDRSLEDRAIPFYYGAPQGVLPVHQAWSHAMSSKGMERYIYSYNAPRYAAQGGAANTAKSQIGAFDFFRIEGHVGWEVHKAADTLRALVRSQNLPIDVETVLIGKDRGKVIWDPPIRNLDLYRWQHMMKSEVANKLQYAVEYSKKFADQVTGAVNAKVIGSDDMPESVELPGFAANQSTAIALHAQKASEKLLTANYDMNSKWQDDVINVATVAAEFRQKFSPVTKLDSVSPLDNIVAQPERWLGWIDGLIKDGEDKKADDLMLSNYLAQHPGLEHFGGVQRGGTFVLVHDTAGTVIADFMLPYNCCVDRSAPVKLPPLVPPIKPQKPVFDRPITLVALPDKFKFVRFQEDLKLNVNKDLADYKSYFNIYKDIVLTGGTKTGGLTVPDKSVQVADPVLDAHLAQTKAAEDLVDRLKGKLRGTDLSDDQRIALDQQLQDAQTQLAQSVLKTVDRVASVTPEVSAGSDSAMVLESVSSSLDKVTSADALSELKTGITKIAGKTSTTVGVKTALNNMLTIRGVR